MNTNSVLINEVDEESESHDEKDNGEFSFGEKLLLVMEDGLENGNHVSLRNDGKLSSSANLHLFALPPYFDLVRYGIAIEE